MQLFWTLWILGTATLTVTAWTVRALHRVSQALPVSNADFGFIRTAAFSSPHAAHVEDTTASLVGLQ
jgi:hypothetical protein